ncbi:MAG: galactose-1-phosphate uridylyltransferase [Thermoproteus sp. AZ2]|jgi:UDPglucose--hexose-1-phosphate uridylyltransferase|uniref:Galactose-1-phosphate uridylyltransferase n=1 Tax=Thermoproteus sp. AZ2 TaxID=1609232 RepID=A0ACC6V195_9CREN|nr:MAG: galactose-1-phosphate uridylyltransferase [Thermoproteus sp. AZ2]
MSEIRQDPTTGDWILVAPRRVSRPWQPSDFCPFDPGAPETGYGWDALILPNRYPVVAPDAPEVEPDPFYARLRAYGRALVVVETPEHGLDDISDLPEAQIRRVLGLVAEEMAKAASDPAIAYFLFFRNKGREIGVSLTHPHSQIYELPVVPARVARELERSKSYYEERGRCLHCDIISAESKSKRVVASWPRWIAFVPFYARWPHEVHLYPTRHVQLFTELGEEELDELAAALKLVLCGLNKALGKPMPYMMVLHQAPLRGGPYPHYHLHFEIYGMYRPDGKLKYAASAETGANIYTLDTTPEDAAERIRAGVEICSASRLGHA